MINNAKLSVTKIYVTWSARVVNLLEHDEVHDELNFAGEHADANIFIPLAGDVEDAGQGEDVPWIQQLTPQQIWWLKVKTKSILMGSSWR